MKTDIKRRLLLKGSLGATTLGVALGAGLLSPKAVLAWNEAAFHAKSADEAMNTLFGSSAAAESADVKLEAPEIAENGAVVPIKITTEMAAESISVIAPNNPIPLVATFMLGAGTKAFASTRIKMGKTGDVVAVVKSGSGLHSAKKNVKVTVGGCGG
jgi:sulfur-oxidizing protein SoxY